MYKYVLEVLWVEGHACLDHSWGGKASGSKAEGETEDRPIYASQRQLACSLRVSTLCSRDVMKVKVNLRP